MCGRATLTTPDLSTVAALTGSVMDPGDAALYRPRYNLAPSDLHWIVRSAGGDGARRLVRAIWGVAGDGQRPIVNARAETAGRQPLFRTALERTRCVVPVDGFYEWTGDKKHRRPIWYRSAHGSLLLLAGLYQLRADGVLAFVVLTTGANALVAKVHDRMPVILPPARVDAWLAAPVGALLTPASDEALVAVPVSTRVNSVRHDDPACLAPAGQMSLF